MRQFLAALTFYTSLPLSATGALDFKGIARWAPGVGLAVGLVLAGCHVVLTHWVPNLVRAVLLVVVWLVVTAGLHVDGVMDAADGLSIATVDPDDRQILKRRLEVMADSYTGAFGAISAIVLILLKVVAIAHVALIPAWIVLVLVPAWGRWGQLLAIAFYPYLKERGKGRFLKDSTSLPDIWPATAVLSVLSLGWGWRSPVLLSVCLWTGGCAIAAGATGYWFYRQLGGHTGDTYGAVVEWTEAIALVLATIVPQ
ncbi:MAG: adenosylcobinamide-GDP ribazoletransferase [Cyanobacteria bacterium J06642_2]